MNKKDLIKGINTVLGNFEFMPNSVGAGSVSLVNDNCEIIIAYNKYPGIFVLASSITGYKSFPEVENILKPLFEKYRIGYLQYTIYKQSRRCEDIFDVEIAKIEDIERVSSQLRMMVYEDILPFFDEYQTTLQVLNRVETLPKEDISKFIFLPQLPRIMILKRIHNSSDWEQFCDWSVDIYKTMASGPNGGQHLLVSKLVTDLQLILRSQEL